jgi:hypothetical protein
MECTDPEPLLWFLQGQASDRKLNLYIVATYRRVWNFIPERGRRMVEVIERFLDEEATREELIAAATAADRGQFIDKPWEHAMSLQRESGADLLRDIFGNPFRPVTVESSWLKWNGRTVIQLARSIYQDGNFNDLPILADALEESGCNDPDILGHLRSPGPHVRGCWVVDLVLGKG